MDRRPESNQVIEGKIVRFRSGRLGMGLGLGIRIADLNQVADLKPSMLITYFRVQRMCTFRVTFRIRIRVRGNFNVSV